MIKSSSFHPSFWITLRFNSGIGVVTMCWLLTFFTVQTSHVILQKKIRLTQDSVIKLNLRYKEIRRPKSKTLKRIILLGNIRTFTGYIALTKNMWVRVLFGRLLDCCWYALNFRPKFAFTTMLRKKNYKIKKHCHYAC